ncbi:cytochrome c oxidase subunit 3 [Ketobacter sp. MCCC 1A13808]|uniref:cytochrome c oxidase subunit 3 n=1 Tax=Ketobacter sp. MCCC 1A13808 TaxID=2602738 RepID=UPI000F10B3E5|nr:cytochrome c oxidase subunit 3 [Ketobacter sp. MCCC 1A13808]MVF11290.1 cytochrome c oxidase subunit 3 [Ketobacter sp. MCCC 1A13808]RLP53579.1 MAG: cytochrome c oxidase subunit 3 [Ketobacter sp.]
MAEKPTSYYVPEQSPWPFITAVALFLVAFGAANFVQQHSVTGLVANDSNSGSYILPIGILGIIAMMFVWFRDTVRESLANMNSDQMDRSYRMGMLWFIFSEVMFFAAFFGALFYVRLLALPWLAGGGEEAMTHELLWPDFQNLWPLTLTPGGTTTQAMPAWGLPLLNTALLVTSSITLTIAHHALIAGNRAKLNIFLFLTLILGYTFLFFQVEEYIHAYNDLGLTLQAGIYGSTFFMLTGFHGMHVTIGAIMLTIMLIRSMKGHLTPDNHFAFEASAWYWHFVDVVWLFLFVCVYWL